MGCCRGVNLPLPEDPTSEVAAAGAAVPILDDTPRSAKSAQVPNHRILTNSDESTNPSSVQHSLPPSESHPTSSVGRLASTTAAAAASRGISGDVYDVMPERSPTSDTEHESDTADISGSEGADTRSDAASTESYEVSQRLPAKLTKSTSSAVGEGGVDPHTLKFKWAGTAVLVVTVTDTGRGMTPAEQRGIFTPFSRLHSAQEGTGLGLNIARKAMRAHGGDVRVHSEGLGKGCTFIVSAAIRLKRAVGRKRRKGMKGGTQQLPPLPKASIGKPPSSPIRALSGGRSSPAGDFSRSPGVGPRLHDTPPLPHLPGTPGGGRRGCTVPPPHRSPPSTLTRPASLYA